MLNSICFTTWTNANLLSKRFSILFLFSGLHRSFDLNRIICTWFPQILSFRDKFFLIFVCRFLFDCIHYVLCTQRSKWCDSFVCCFFFLIWLCIVQYFIRDSFKWNLHWNNFELSSMLHHFRSLRCVVQPKIVPKKSHKTLNDCGLFASRSIHWFQVPRGIDEIANATARLDRLWFYDAEILCWTICR